MSPSLLLCEADAVPMLGWDNCSATPVCALCVFVLLIYLHADLGTVPLQCLSEDGRYL